MQKEAGITFVYVTHDQTEALALSHRIAVMNRGRVEQVDAPDGSTACRSTRFVADFIGTCNLLTGPDRAAGSGVIAIDVADLGPVRVAGKRRDARGAKRGRRRVAAREGPPRARRAPRARREPLRRHRHRPPLPRRRHRVPRAHRRAATRSRRCSRTPPPASRASSRSATPSSSPGPPMPATSSIADMTPDDFGKWLVERTAAPVPARVLRGAVAHHGAGVVPHARRVRRPRAAARRRRQSRSHARELRALLRRAAVLADLPQVVLVRARHHADLPRARLPAGVAHRAQRPQASRPPAAARDPAVLEQLPDPRVRVDDHPRPQRGARARRSTACSACSASSRCRCSSARSRCSCASCTCTCRSWCCRCTPTSRSTTRRCSTPRRTSAPARGSASGASRSRCRCRASTRARRSCSSRRSASSPSRTSWAAPTTASSATSSSSSSSRRATGRSAACCRSC